MNKLKLIAGLRLLVGTLVLIAIGTQISQLISLGAFNAGNFFSYFTNLTNLFAAMVFIATGIQLFCKVKPSMAEDVLRGANTFFMASVGVVYATLLSQYELGLLLPWVNIVLHYLMPAIVVLDWLVTPPRAKLSLRHALLWLTVPLLYLGYSLVRGAIVQWYPYPFLDPSKPGGYGRVGLYCLGIAVFMFVFVLLVKGIGNWRSKRR